MNLKNKIQILLDNGFSYNQLGKICECHPTSISKWLQTDYKISKRMEESIENHIRSFIKNLYEIWM
jgi:hypothetical protein